MTTIAYKDGIIAYDSRCCCGNTIIDDDFNKMREEGGVKLFFSGSIGDAELLFNWYLGKSKQTPSDGCRGIIVDKKKVSSIGYSKSEEVFYDNREPPNSIITIGTGEDHALTAMDMGATAKEAVKMAMKRDSGTGGRIRTYKIK